MDQDLLVPWVVGVCIVIYVMLFVLMAYWDRHNHIVRPKVIIMCDIKKIREETFYLLLVETGNNFLAGSTANVCCQIYGEKGRSKEYVLSDKNLDTTRQNGYDTYLVSSTKNLGQLEKIRIWHDNSGHTASWYCRQIIVRDIKTDEFWIFFVHRWLTVSMENESLICRQPVATPIEVELYLKNRFTFRRYWSFLREHHIWLCPATCAPRSTFLRSERLTCAMTVLCMYMFILIWFFGTPEDSSSAETSELFGADKVGYNVFWIGFVTSVICLFAGLVLVQLFRRIRRERIPAIICWDKSQLPHEPPKRVKVKGGVREVYRNHVDLHETDSDGSEDRWEKLPKNREMVVGIPKPALMKTPIAVATSSPYYNEGGGENRVFGIPSTDSLETETWIAETLQSSNGVPNSMNMSRKISNKPDKKITPAWKRLMEFGLLGQVEKMRNADSSAFIYQSSAPIDNLIENSIREACKDDPNYDIFGSNSAAKSGAKQKQKSLVVTEGKTVGFDDPELQLIRNAKVQTHEVKPGHRQPLAKYVPKPRDSDQPESEEEISDSALTPRESVLAPAPFVNPITFIVEIGEVDQDYQHDWIMVPRKYLFVPWLVCFCIVVVCSIFTIVYGTRYSNTRATDWGRALLFTLLVSIFIIQPLRVLIRFLWMLNYAKRHKLKSREEERIFTKFKLIWISGSLYEHVNAVKLRPLNYLLYMPTFHQPPLSGAQILMNKLNVRRKSRIRKSLIDFIVGSLLLTLLIYAGHLLRDTQYYQNFRVLQDLFVLGNDTDELRGHPTNTTFETVRTNEQFLAYMNNTFVPRLFLVNDTVATDDTVLGTQATIRTLNDELVLLGVPRIRQLRVIPGANNCTADPIKPFCNEEFTDEWYYRNVDKNDYSENWTEWTPAASLGNTFPGNHLWRYFHAEETLSTYTPGEFDEYEGGGYIANLGRVQNTSFEVLRNITESNWLDDRTRIIMVELGIYNPSLNLHSIVILLLEKSNSLHYFASSDVFSWRFPIPNESNDDLFYFSGRILAVALLVFSLCLLYFFVFAMITFVNAYQHHGLIALKSFLLWLDMSITVLGITAVWFQFNISTSIERKLGLLGAAANDSYVSFQNEEEDQRNQIDILSALTAFVICKLWYLLLISSRLFFTIGFTLSITGPFIIGLITIFLILLMGFCIGAQLNFGQLRRYRTIGHAILTQIYHAGVRNVMPYHSFVEISPIIGRIFFFTFTVFVVFLFINVMACVLTLGLQEAKETSLQRPFRISYSDYIWFKLQLILPKSVRKLFENANTGLSEQREEHMERVLVPILWNHLASISIQRIREMKRLVETQVTHTDCKLSSKKDKELAKKLKILKIEEGRVNRMRELTIKYIKEKLKIDFEAEELTDYDNFNFAVLQLKCRQLDKKLEALGDTLDKYDFQKQEKAKFQQLRNTEPITNTKTNSDPWESETDSVTRLI